MPKHVNKNDVRFNRLDVYAFSVQPIIIGFTMTAVSVSLMFTGVLITLAVAGLFVGMAMSVVGAVLTIISKRSLDAA